jgi:hypothetical protein
MQTNLLLTSVFLGNKHGLVLILTTKFQGTALRPSLGETYLLNPLNEANLHLCVARRGKSYHLEIVAKISTTR